LVGGCEFFVSDVISEVVFGPFWLMLPGLWPNEPSFQWKLQQILWSSGSALGQLTWVKTAKNIRHLWCHSQKQKLQTKNFFFLCRPKDLPNLFECLNSSLVQSMEEQCCW